MTRPDVDHGRIDDILIARISAEDGELGGFRRLLTPLNRLASRRVLLRLALVGFGVRLPPV